ncbi:MAG: heterodisulfide reductase-related iron-sulfur binding cluster [Pseudomonadota bacterium]|nr:heterodisulfide reductase-related iron-sulfur binding cluster [Pseudomonadota bacterium]MDP1903098.1 heterodisulfide reductase-related iron-sulfur binding cluster [Pseudomonadota bacterium]MDP2353088.1 heterodisulfide reductase-related iron-sulfur binding cluster [Pseudomonadota bacterium]
MATSTREGNLEAPTRHPLDWRNPDFHDETSLYTEMERVFDICHGCRRCVSLCQSFPTLFDLVDESATFEVDGVAKADYWTVVDHCYLCDLCYMTKCPYVPPHEWNLDFPHLMLRAKVVKFRKGDIKLRDRVLTSTDAVGNLAGIPVVAPLINAVNKLAPARKAMEAVAEIHAEAWLPTFHSQSLRSRLRKLPDATPGEPAGRTKGKVALFATCYMNRNEPGIGEDFAAVYEHNGIPVTLAEKERCCGMPKLELGDLDAVIAAKETNIPQLAKLVDAGWDLTALIPSCVLMFKQELPLMFPDDPDVQKVKAAFFDPFEYLMLRHKEGKLKTNFKQGLGKVAYHAACHQRVQNIGQKTREILALVPDTEVEIIERCSGHDGTYAVKKESHAFAMKIVKPVVGRVTQAKADHYGSDCAMAGHHIENAMKDGRTPEHPMTLLRKAYGL